MEDPLVVAGEGSIEVSLNSEPKKSMSAVNAKRTAMVKPSITIPTGTTRKRIEPKAGSQLSSTVTKSTISGSSRGFSAVPMIRRKSTGGLPEKQPVSVTSKQQNSVSSVAERKTTSVTSSEPLMRSLPEVRRKTLLPPPQSH